MSNQEYWIWFSSLRGLSSFSRQTLLNRFGTAKYIYHASGDQLLPCLQEPSELDALSDRDLDPARKIISRCEEENIQIITFQDAAYPERLANIPDPPYVLYVKGRLPDVDAGLCIGIVGTRRSTPYGDKTARNLSYEISRCGAVVVTGLAGGIDSRAAEGALLANRPVIGVLGTAVNEIYPAFNAPLFADVAAIGALVSEYPPDATVGRSGFPARNRIIAGLSRGIVVVEAPEKSGALITAFDALETGRDVFAVPGNVDAPNSSGTFRLLREGAIPVSCGADILSEYPDFFPRLDLSGEQKLPSSYAVPLFDEKESLRSGKNAAGGTGASAPLQTAVETAAEKQRKKELLSSLSEMQLSIVAAIETPDTPSDEIIERTGLPAARVMAELTVLQIRGLVSQSAGKRFSLKFEKEM